jgi:esterase
MPYRTEPMGPEDRYLEVNGVRLHYLEWGEPDFETLLFLHGFMGHAHVWDHVAPTFAERYRVLALDQRGHGESDWANDASYTISDHYVDLCGFIEALDLSGLNVIGHSMGGRNALFYAACSSAGRVKRLILVDARPGNNPEASKAIKDFVLTLPLRIHVVDEAAAVFKRLYPHLTEEFCRHVVRYGFKEAEDGTLIPRHDVRMNRLSEQSNFEAEDLWPFLGNIASPTMVIRGENSSFLSRAEAERMSLCIPRGRFQEISCSTHLPAQENPEAFIEAVLRFLDS